MRWKMYASMTTLILILTISVAPIKLVAQGLEYALILVVVGVGENETAKIYWRPSPSQGKPQKPQAVPGDGIIFTYVVTNPSDVTCTQTIKKPLLDPLLFGQPIQVTSISKRFGFVTFADDVPIKLVDECFKDPQSQRVVIQAGVQYPDIRKNISDNSSPLPSRIPAGFPHIQVLSFSIVGQDGNTLTSGGSMLVMERSFSVGR